MKNDLICEQFAALASRGEVVSFPPPLACFNRRVSELSEGHRAARPQKQKPAVSDPGELL